MQKARLVAAPFSESVLIQVYQVEGIVRPGFSQVNHCILCGLQAKWLWAGLDNRWSRELSDSAERATAWGGLRAEIPGSNLTAWSIQKA